MSEIEAAPRTTVKKNCICEFASKRLLIAAGLEGNSCTLPFEPTLGFAAASLKDGRMMKLYALFDFAMPNKLHRKCMRSSMEPCGVA